MSKEPIKFRVHVDHEQFRDSVLAAKASVAALRRDLRPWWKFWRRG